MILKRADAVLDPLEVSFKRPHLFKSPPPESEVGPNQAELLSRIHIEWAIAIVEQCQRRPVRRGEPWRRFRRPPWDHLPAQEINIGICLKAGLYAPDPVLTDPNVVIRECDNLRFCLGDPGIAAIGQSLLRLENVPQFF